MSLYLLQHVPLGKKIAFVAEQTGHSIRTLEARYKKYFPSADDLEIPDQGVAVEGGPRISSTFSLHPEAKVEKNGGA